METDLALLVLRVVIGGTLAAHGAQKLFGWFGGNGLARTSGFFGNGLRLRPAVPWAVLAGLSEFGGGLLLVLGLLSPLGSLGVIASMVMAALLLHWPRFFAADNGSEYPLVLAGAAAAVALTGPGALSLDALWGTALPAPAAFLVGLAGVAVGIGLALITRAPAATVDAESRLSKAA